MSSPDAASEFLVRLALDDDFRRDFNATPEEQRAEFLRQKLAKPVDALDKTVRDALISKNIAQINEHVFQNQQTSFTSARSMVNALDAFLTSIEAEKKP